MRGYRPGDSAAWAEGPEGPEGPGGLEPWPFDTPASAYVIRQGDPRASGRLEAGGAGQPTRQGIWRCTRGVFECTEQGDEMMTILAGRCRITDHASGVTLELGPGDTAFTEDGARVTWEIVEDVTKVFLGYKPGGF